MNKYQEIIDIAERAYKKVTNEDDDENLYKYNSIYSFTTENIKSYYKKEDIFNKDILTVTSSGDHMFNAMLLGAKSIDCFDINVFTKYYVQLKSAAIKVLNYEDFFTFFLVEKNKLFKNKKVFNKATYQKIRDYLPLDAKIFWDILFIYKEGYKLKTSPLFFKDVIKSEIIRYNLYLEEEKFYKLKNIINNYDPKFYNCNIIDLPNISKKLYDTIYLSNIINYSGYYFDAPIIINYKNFIENKLSKMLKNNGLIFLAYLYSNYSINDKEYFNESHFEIKNIAPISYEGKDKLYVYKKD